MADPPQTTHSEPKAAVTAALLGNGAVAVLKLVAAILSGSIAMLAESAHSLADTGNQAMLLLGLRLSSREADRDHPFGYGKERYFWTFLAATSMFIIGAVFSILQGIQGLQGEAEISHLPLSFAVLAGVALFESVGLVIAARSTWPQIRARGVWGSIRETKDPTAFVVLFEDSAALLGLGLAASGLFLSWLTGLAVYDGLASVLIGLLLGGVAVLLGFESRSLLLGEAVGPATRRKMLAAVRSFPEVREIIRLQTMHMGPTDILVGLEINLIDRLTTDEIEVVIDRIEEAIQVEVPSARQIYVECESESGRHTRGPTAQT